MEKIRHYVPGTSRIRVPKISNNNNSREKDSPKKSFDDWVDEAQVVEEPKEIAEAPKIDNQQNELYFENRFNSDIKKENQSTPYAIEAYKKQMKFFPLKDIIYNK